MKSKVDIVITYVNPSDPKWMKDAEKYGVMSNSASSGEKRYRDDGTLRLCLESIRKFCDFYENIYLVVSSKSQVPEYAKEYSVKTIEHREFIPKEYLPCFNSCTIETFFPFLPIKNERFLYFNDDMILCRPVHEWRFFKGSAPLLNVNIKKKSEYSENRCTLNAYNLITRTNQREYSVGTTHGVTSFNINQMKECWDRYRDELISTVHPLGRTDECVSQCVYSFYDFCYHFSGNQQTTTKMFHGLGKYRTFDWNSLGRYDCICMNTPERGNIYEFVKKVKDYLYEQVS